MSQINLSQSMQFLLSESEKNKLSVKQIIAKAVQLGMDYQEQKIKSGINIVFDSLHIKTQN